MKGTGNPVTINSRYISSNHISFLTSLLNDKHSTSARTVEDTMKEMEMLAVPGIDIPVAQKVKEHPVVKVLKSQIEVLKSSFADLDECRRYRKLSSSGLRSEIDDIDASTKHTASATEFFKSAMELTDSAGCDVRSATEDVHSGDKESAAVKVAKASAKADLASKRRRLCLAHEGLSTALHARFKAKEDVNKAREEVAKAFEARCRAKLELSNAMGAACKLPTGTPEHDAALKREDGMAEAENMLTEAELKMDDVQWPIKVWEEEVRCATEEADNAARRVHAYIISEEKDG
jgi:septation ring formation regulator EzrA